MDITDLLRRIQAAYPRIYLACHADHGAQRSTTLSQRDATILAHLERDHPVTQAELARHLGIVKSTMSEAVKHLAGAGYVHIESARDKRASLLRLSASGQAAMSATSVLEADKLRALLLTLTPADAQRAVAGLELLAAAALRMNHGDSA